MSKRSGSVNWSGSRPAEADSRMIASPRPTPMPPSSRSSRGNADEEMHRRVVAQYLFDRPGCQSRLDAEALELVGVAKQRQHPVGDEVVRGRMPGAEQQPAGRVELAKGQTVALLLYGEQVREQIVTRVTAPPNDELLEIRAQILERLADALPGPEPEPVDGPVRARRTSRR